MLGTQLVVSRTTIQAVFPRTLQLSTVSIKKRAASLPLESISAIYSPWNSALAAITIWRPISRGLNRTRHALSVIGFSLLGWRQISPLSKLPVASPPIRLFGGAAHSWSTPSLFGEGVAFHTEAFHNRATYNLVASGTS